MSKVITFSRVFPKGNKREGQPTFFVEKIYKSLFLMKTVPPELASSFNFAIMNDDKYFPKHHTIRGGNRWKVGDKFSPRVWSGKPYNSKQIILADDIEIKKVLNIEIINQKVIINGVFFGEYARGFYDDNVATLANNDGLSLVDFENWFGNKFFQGQIICWSDAVSYGFA